MPSQTTIEDALRAKIPQFARALAPVYASLKLGCAPNGQIPDAVDLAQTMHSLLSDAAPFGVDTWISSGGLRIGCEDDDGLVTYYMRFTHEVVVYADDIKESKP